MSEHAADDLRTGDPRVDAVLESLSGLDDLPVDQHPEAYERIHGALRAVLAHAGDDDADRRADDAEAAEAAEAP